MDIISCRQARVVFLSIFAISSASCVMAREPGFVRGNYYWGHEVESLEICKTGNSYWVVGSDRLLESIRAEAEKLAKERDQPYQPVYIEAVAVLESKPSDGFSADYDGVYRLSEIKRFSVLSPSDCLPKKSHK